MAKSLGRRILGYATIALLVILISYEKQPSKPKQEISYRVTFPEVNTVPEVNEPVLTSEEQETVYDFDLDYRDITSRRLTGRPFKHIVDRMLKGYENLSPYMREQVKDETEGGLAFLRGSYWDANDFCPYHSEAIRLGLEVEGKQK